jgi:hypothetical protein
MKGDKLTLVINFYGVDTGTSIWSRTPELLKSFGLGQNDREVRV